MKARLTHLDISTALAAVKPSVSAARPFVRLRQDGDGLSVTADDLNVGVTATIPSWAPLGDDNPDGTVIVAHRPLTEFVSQVDDDVEIVGDDTSAVIAVGRTRIELPCAIETVFPERRPPDEGVVGATLDGDQWEAVQALVPFCSTDPAHGPRTGVNFFEDMAVASDGFAMGIVHASFGFHTVVPADVIAAVGVGADKVELAADDRVMRLAAGGVTVITSRLAGHLADTEANWRPFFDATATATLRLERIEDWNRAAAVARIPSRSGALGGRDLIVAFDDPVMLRSSVDPQRPSGQAEVELPATVTDVDWPLIVVNDMTLGRAMAFIDDGESDITWEMTGQRKPIILRRDDRWALAMPLFRDS